MRHYVVAVGGLEHCKQTVSRAANDIAGDRKTLGCLISFTPSFSSLLNYISSNLKGHSMCGVSSSGS